MNTRKRASKGVTQVVEMVKSFLPTDSARLGYLEERAIAMAAIRLADLLESLGCSQKALAERMAVTPARVSQILSAEENVSIRTLARAGAALGFSLDLEFRPEAHGCSLHGPTSHVSVRELPRWSTGSPQQSGGSDVVAA